MDRPPCPFDLSQWESHIPEIEKRISDLNPHVIVCGLGPSAYLLNKLDKDLIKNIRLWGVNDFFKIMPCHDLTLMDSPVRELDPSGDRYKYIIQSKPERWWIYEQCHKSWSSLIGDNAKKNSFDLTLWHPQQNRPPNQSVPLLQGRPYHHTIASPIGTIALAWGDGCRRIGFIGVDLLVDNHKLSNHNLWIKWFLKHFSKQAKKLNGSIVNLSPFSTVGVHPDTEAKP